MEELKEERYFTILKEMFSARGYSGIRVEEDGQYLLGNKEGGTVVAVLGVIEKLNTNTIQKYVSLMKERDNPHFILVYKGEPTPAAKNAVATLPPLEITAELFRIEDLQFNILKHSLVPVHIKLPKAEAEKFKKEHGVKIQRMLTTDPVARFLGLEKGDVVEIVRHDGYITYRIVV